MSAGNHNVIFIIPIATQEIAKRISRSLDPDSGGYGAFQTLASLTGLEPATHCIYGTPCRQEFLDQLAVITSSASALKAAIDADYAARWPGEVVPTLAECEALLADLQIFIDASWDDALTQAGLTITQPQ